MSLQLHNNVILVVEFQRWWVLKSKLCGPKATFFKETIVFCEQNEQQFVKQFKI